MSKTETSLFWKIVDTYLVCFSYFFLFGAALWIGFSAYIFLTPAGIATDMREASPVSFATITNLRGRR